MKDFFHAVRNNGSHHPVPVSSSLFGNNKRKWWEVHSDEIMFRRFAVSSPNFVPLTIDY